MADTAIEWATKVWNPTTGCDRVSAGCDHCYALTMAKRLKGMGSAKYQLDGNPATSGPGFGINTHPGSLYDPTQWRKPERIFVNSMSDLFHDGVPDGFIAQVWEVMAQCPQHMFMILTKRHARMRSWVSRWHDNTGDSDVRGPNSLPPMPRGPEAVREVYSSPRAMLFADMLDNMGTPPPGAAYPLYDWAEGPRWWPGVLPNVALGVSVEDDETARRRIPALLETRAAIRFISAEPTLGHIAFQQHWMHPIMRDPSPEANARGRIAAKANGVGLIDWVIAGGESGPGARPMHPDWVRSLRDQCQNAGVPFLFKQWGEWSPYAPAGAERSPDTYVSAKVHGGGCLCVQAPMWRVGKKAAGRELDGHAWDQYPVAMGVM